MADIQSFLSPSPPSLKICGVTLPEDADALVEAQVPSLGINFWPQSKRYCAPATALEFLPGLKGKVVRVGVFVNNAREVAPQLLEKEALDIIQLHGDEEEAQLVEFLRSGVPVIRSLALKADDQLEEVAAHYKNLAAKTSGTLVLLLDAHAPGVYGGTGETIDWKQAANFVQLAAPLPVLLAGGLVPENAAAALALVHPAGLDVASGAESSPGIKDFCKVSALLAATQSPSLS